MTTLLSSPATITVFAAGTASLETGAANMPVGTFVEVTGLLNASVMLDSVSGGVGHILNYCDKLLWDPQGKSCYYAGSDDPGQRRKFVRYDVTTNAITDLTASSPWANASGVNHSYSNTDIDRVGRILFIGQGDGVAIHRYDIRTATWTSIGSPASQDAPSMAYFPERKSLIYLVGSRLFERPDATAAWTALSSSVRSSYHSICNYNSYHKIVVFGGGNDTNTVLYRVSASGTVTQIAQTPPFGLESPRCHFIEDPSTGDFIVYYMSGSNKQRYRFNPMTGVWTNLTMTGVPALAIGAGSPWDGNLLMVGGAMPEYKVQAYLSHPNGYGDFHLFLYRYAA